MYNVHFILTLTPPWLQVKVVKYFDFGNLDVWRVAVCVRFSSETTQPISPMLIPIYRVNNVDLQHIHHFDLHPSMTAGQGHKILQFCEFRLLPWHECWHMSGPYKVAGNRLDRVGSILFFSKQEGIVWVLVSSYNWCYFSESKIWPPLYFSNQISVIQYGMNPIQRLFNVWTYWTTCIIMPDIQR